MDDQSKLKFSVSKKLVSRLVIALLLVTNIVTIALWQTSGSLRNNQQVISVTGQTTITAEPDEYLFQPNYTFSNSSKDEALKQIEQKQTEVTTKLKELGVGESDIKVNNSGYSSPESSQSPDSSTQIAPAPPDGRSIYSLNMQVAVSDKDLAQKVQDYLIATSPEGQISPKAVFSEQKQKQLEDQAREEATKDARSKAEQLASNAGAKLGEVKSIQDGNGFGQPEPLIYKDNAVSSQDSSRSLEIYAGKNEINYSVSVEYYLK